MSDDEANTEKEPQPSKTWAQKSKWERAKTIKDVLALVAAIVASVTLIGGSFVAAWTYLFPDRVFAVSAQFHKVGLPDAYIVVPEHYQESSDRTTPKLETVKTWTLLNIANVSTRPFDEIVVHVDCEGIAEVVRDDGRKKLQPFSVTSRCRSG